MDERRLAYLQLTLTSGIGPQILMRLLDTFGDPQSVFSASPQELVEVDGVGVALSRRLRSQEARPRAEEVLEICQGKQIRLLFPEDDEFPRLLKELADPPMLLFVRGELLPSDGLSVAMVGTRSATTYGKNQTTRFAMSLSRGGLTIVSGLARGIDTCAHLAAIEAGGRTLAVLSNGVAEVYPPQNEELAEQIIDNGALVSEMPPGTKPRKGMFPLRNRIISGLSLGVIVMEAGERSGALITARLAGEQGRETFALPGLVSTPNARGANQLIRDGAILVQEPEHVLESLGPMVEGIELSPEVVVRRPSELQLNEQEMAVLQAISVEPTDINQVVSGSGLPVPRVLSTLSVLEMRHLVRRVSGQVVQRL